MKKRKRRRKKLITVYIARAVAALIALIMITLMFCGCLYIRDLFKKEDKPAEEPNISTDANVGSKVEKENKSTESPYSDVRIVIDAGHGGNDGGTVSGDIIEKDINFAIALKVQAALEEQGVTVIMTRTYDDYVSLDDRVYTANQSDADLFVSLHCNYFEDDSSVDGLETFYCANAEGSQRFAESIADVARQQDEIAVRGATQNAYYVTRHTTMDAILIEMGFMSNTTECQKLISENYQSLLAQTIVDGILQVFHNEDL